jgi:hypothetical protein
MNNSSLKLFQVNRESFDVFSLTLLSNTIKYKKENHRTIPSLTIHSYTSKSTKQKVSKANSVMSIKCNKGKMNFSRNKKIG